MSARAPLSLDLQHPSAVEPSPDEAWPPPPHDPRERDLALLVAGWEVRLFSGRKFAYFVTHGFWHLQLWHPVARVSVLTPSRLTRGRYEACPIANWKAQAPDYARLVTLLDGLVAAKLPDHAAVLRLERALVTEVVRGSGVLS